MLAAWTGAILEHRDPVTNLLHVPEGDGTIGGPVASPERYVSSGFEWQLRNRVFMADRYRLPAGAQSNRDYLSSVDEARRWLKRTWAAHPPWNRRKLDLPGGGDPPGPSGRRQRRAGRATARPPKPARRGRTR